MHSIRVKITAIVIAAILTGIVSVIGVSFFTVETQNDRSTAAMLNLLCVNVQKSLDDYIESIEQSTEMTANIAGDSLDSLRLAEYGVVGSKAGKSARTAEQTEKLDAYLAEYCKRVQEDFQSVADHTQGVVTYYYCIDTSVSENEHGFFYSNVGRSGFEEQPPLDARDLDPEDTEHTTWYYTPIKRGRPSWVGPYLAHYLNEEWTVSYLVPIYKSGTLIGVLGMDIFLETLINRVRPISVYDTGFACLLDAEGHVLYHPELKAGSFPDVTEMSLTDDVLYAENSGDKLIRYSSGGIERQMAFSTLGNGMKLIITVPVKEITAPWRDLTRIVFIATAVIIAAFSVIMLFVMRIITRPLQHLTAASERLADGDYDVELNYSGKDEVGTLTRAFSRMRDHIKKYVSELRRKIYTDDLTGLSNMRGFFYHADNNRRLMLEAGGSPALLYFDMIGMKYFNRQYGFEEGNSLICAIADILRRHYDEKCCSRFGQDHFAVLADEAGMEDELRTIFTELASANGGLTLSVRVGIYPMRLGSVDISVACDRAKYAFERHRTSLESGFYYFDRRLLSQSEIYRYVIGNLDTALKENWIKVYFQPIVRASSGKACEEEALSRWIDPKKGVMSPGDFIPILESSRLIYKLDLYVLDHIIRKMQTQSEAGLYVVPQSINLSRVDFDTCDIVGEICSRMDAAGISREKLTIEITESAVGENFDFMKEQINRLRDLGFHVWMDDFGSGYSTLDALQDIQFDLIKLDMRFMKRFSESETSRIILTELIHMAVSLGIETVAEGVETKEQADFLTEAGCTKLQGFYFSKAMPYDEIIERSRNGKIVGFESKPE
ncbi:MAG: EAL domain-containing protein [Lachnospiraceae bacterium]|nr:EAL domain-containing protein [Lachnospiraceae bacterium]